MNDVLSLQIFQTLTKADFYQSYVDLFEKVGEKGEIIKQYAVKTSDLLSGVGATKLMEYRSTSIISAEQFATKARPFQVFPIKEVRKSMVIESSNMTILVDQSIQTDIVIHA